MPILSTPGIPFDPQFEDNTGLSRSAIQLDIERTNLDPIVINTAENITYSRIKATASGNMSISATNIIYSFKELAIVFLNESAGNILLSFDTNFIPYNPNIGVGQYLTTQWISVKDKNDVLKYYLKNVVLI